MIVAGAPSRVLASLRYVGGGWEAATVRVLPTGTVIGAGPARDGGSSVETAGTGVTLAWGLVQALQTDRLQIAWHPRL